MFGIRRRVLLVSGGAHSSGFDCRREDGDGGSGGKMIRDEDWFGCWLSARGDSNVGNGSVGLRS